MAENRYNFATHATTKNKLDRLDITIVKWGLNHPVKYWNLIRRLSRFWLIYWNDTLGAVLEFRDRTITMLPGKMVLIPPYTLVTARTNSPFIHNFVEFEVGHPFTNVKSIPLEFSAAEYAPSVTPESEKAHLSLALYILTERLLLAVPPEHVDSSGIAAFEPRIQALLKYMNSHPTQKYSINELAETANLSVSRLLHLFKKETGITPRDYWLKQRLELVCRLLETTDLSISEIADQVGFTDRSHLSRIMKAELRLTPAALRRQISERRK